MSRAIFATTFILVIGLACAADAKSCKDPKTGKLIKCAESVAVNFQHVAPADLGKHPGKRVGPSTKPVTVAGQGSKSGAATHDQATGVATTKTVTP